MIAIEVIWRHLWCNSYHHRKLTWQYEFKSWTSLFAFHIFQISLEKTCIQLFSLKIWVNSSRLSSLTLVKQTTMILNLLNSLQKLTLYYIHYSYYSPVGRVNGVISLVIVFEKLFHILSPFRLCDKVNWEICLFHKQDFKRGDVVICTSWQAHEASLLNIPDLRRVSSLHLFAVWTFLFVPWTLVILV